MRASSRRVTARRCARCGRRLRRGQPSVSITDRATGREVRFHGAHHSPGCQEAAAEEATRKERGEIHVQYFHARACGDARGGFDCKHGCFGTEAPAKFVTAS